jgi:hypothetical protein
MIKDYLSKPPTEPWFGPEEGSAVLRMQADLNGDGQDEVLLSRAGLTNGQQGHIWNVYSPKKGAFAYVGQCIFHPAAVFIGKFEDNEWGIVTYFRDGPDRGALMLVTVTEEGMQERKLRDIGPGENEEDAKLYGTLFYNDNEAKIQEIPLEEAKRMAGIENVKPVEGNSPGQTAAGTVNPRQPPTEPQKSQPAPSSVSAQPSPTQKQDTERIKPSVKAGPPAQDDSKTLIVLALCVLVVVIAAAIMYCVKKRHYVRQK